MKRIVMRLVNLAGFKPVLLATLVVSAFAVNADSPKSVAVGTPPVPLLWKVSDADNSVFLLGSFHLLKPGDYPLSKEVDAAFSDAESLVFEMSPEEMASPAVAIQMQQAALRTDGKLLDSDLNASTVELLKMWQKSNANLLQSMGLTPQDLQAREAWSVGLIVSIVEMIKQGLDPKLGLDIYLGEKAIRAGKSTAGLESGAQQIAFLDSMDKIEQLQYLNEALAVSEDGKEEIEKLYAAWRNGKDDVLWHDMGVQMRKEYPSLYQKINVTRNDAWMPKIQRMLVQSSDDDTMVVVGALHLIGPDGLVEKLRAKGYIVKRIR
jgi:uncharacterized protein YbaP (TraB family)